MREMKMKACENTMVKRGRRKGTSAKDTLEILQSNTCF